jgi:hypothetical protein
MGVGLLKFAAIVVSPLAAISSLGGAMIAISMYSPKNFTLQMYLVDAGFALSGILAFVLLFFRRFAASLALAAIHFTTLLVLNLV